MRCVVERGSSARAATWSRLSPTVVSSNASMIEVNRSTIVIAPPPSNENSFYYAIGLDHRDASTFGALDGLPGDRADRTLDAGGRPGAWPAPASDRRRRGRHRPEPAGV